MSITQNPKYTVEDDLEMYTFPSTVNPTQRHFICKGENTEWRLGIVQTPESMSMAAARTLAREVEELLGFMEALNRGDVPGVAQPAPVESDTRPCDDPNCRYESHEWLRGEPSEAHSAEPLHSPDGWFTVHAVKPLDGGEWEVWADAYNLPDGDQLSVAVAFLGETVTEMQERCDRFNAPIRRSTEPGEPDLAGRGGGL